MDNTFNVSKDTCVLEMDDGEKWRGASIWVIIIIIIIIIIRWIGHSVIYSYIDRIISMQLFYIINNGKKGTTNQLHIREKNK